jgi:hypothetical protein
MLGLQILASRNTRYFVYCCIQSRLFLYHLVVDVSICALDSF